jgi:hypothetical protein
LPEPLAEDGFATVDGAVVPPTVLSVVAVGRAALVCDGAAADVVSEGEADTADVAEAEELVAEAAADVCFGDEHPASRALITTATPTLARFPALVLILGLPVDVGTSD